MTNNSTNFNKHHLSLQLIAEVVFVDIGCGIVDHHSMSLGER
jgi:hypothetical protein